MPIYLTHYKNVFYLCFLSLRRFVALWNSLLYKSSVFPALDCECFMVDHPRFISKYSEVKCTVPSDAKLFYRDLLSVKKSYVHCAFYTSSHGNKAAFLRVLKGFVNPPINLNAVAQIHSGTGEGWRDAVCFFKRLVRLLQSGWWISLPGTCTSWLFVATAHACVSQCAPTRATQTPSSFTAEMSAIQNWIDFLRYSWISKFEFRMQNAELLLKFKCNEIELKWIHIKTNFESLPCLKVFNSWKTLTLDC